MFKITPNPPETDDVSPYETADSKKLNDAADRALDYYLKPVIPKDAQRKPSTLFLSTPTRMTKRCWPTPANPWRRQV